VRAVSSAPPRRIAAKTVSRTEPAWIPLPRDGVSASRVAVGDSRFAHVLDFLRWRFPAVADWPHRLAHGDVLDAAGRPVLAGAPCVVGEVLWYWRDPPPEPQVPFEIEVLHRDDHLVVVDKPHFLATLPGGRHLRETVLFRLRRQLGMQTLTPMHRLDRDTAGVLVFIVRPEDRHAYQSLLRERAVFKVYEAVAPWRPDVALPVLCRNRIEEPPGRDFMQMRVVPGEPNAETLIECLQTLPDGLALYRLTPHTGRKHQLRAQMNALGLPLVGDRVYPRLLPEPPPQAVADYAEPLQLLAREYGFTDPLSGEPRRFVSRRRLALAPG